jgi:two-component system, cell cycle sensor histidine kinase and response regulator CckA
MDRRPLAILLIDDDYDDYLIVRDLLRETPQALSQLDWAGSHAAGLDLIAAGGHDAYLIDYHLGAENGLDLITAGLEAGCVAPLLLLTGQDDEHIALAALQAGAADYLVKSQISAPLLQRTLRYAVERAQAASERRRLEEELRQAQKMEAIGRLAGGVAHDFNNVLTAISGYSDLLLNDFDQGQPIQRTDLEQILGAARRAAQLTQQLLAFSRKQLLTPEVLDLNAVIGEMEPMLRRMIGEHVVLSTDLAGGLAPIEADPGQIQQVVMNLAVNARDAMPRGGTLHIATAVQAGRIALLVSDTGEGMDAVTRQRAFEPFFTTKERGKGTGLGLATVYGIVAQSGGEIALWSAPGQGANFTILFPPATTPAPLASGSPIGQRHGGNETVLLVEDDSAVRGLIESVLRSAGYTVLSAPGGAAALALALIYPAPIQLLITDVIMPGMSGVDLVRAFEVSRPELRVLYISGYADDDLTPHGLRAANVAFLAKPFPPDVLARQVRALLDAVISP